MANPHAMAYQFAGNEKKGKKITHIAKGVLISEGDLGFGFIANKWCQITPLIRKFEFPAHKSKQLL